MTADSSDPVRPAPAGQVGGVSSGPRRQRLPGRQAGNQARQRRARKPRPAPPPVDEEPAEPVSDPDDQHTVDYLA
jgi:hypothetical protein